MDNTVPINLEITEDLGETMNNNNKVAYTICNNTNNEGSSAVITKEENEADDEHHETEYVEVQMSTETTENESKEQPEIASQDQSPKKKWWTRYETIELINSVEVHYAELKFQKKNMWRNVSNDLHALNIQVSAKECMIKWKNLLRSYVSVKHAKERKGRDTFKFKFYDEVDNIMGTRLISKPTIVRKPIVDVQRRMELTNELMKLRQDEWDKRQKEWEKRHQEREERILLQKQRLQMEAKKIELLESYIRLKEKEKKLKNIECKND